MMIVDKFQNVIKILKFKIKTQWVYVMVTSQNTVTLPTFRDSREVYMKEKYKAQLFSYKLELFASLKRSYRLSYKSNHPVHQAFSVCLQHGHLDNRNIWGIHWRISVPCQNIFILKNFGWITGTMLI